MNKLLKVILLVMLASGLVMAGCSPSSTLPPANGDKLPAYQLETNLLGKKNEFLVDSEGRLQTKVEVSSAEGRISVSVDEGTIVLDKEGKPLQFIQAAIDSSPPSYPEDACIVGSVYDLGPQGATFDPWLMLTLSYEPEGLPEGVRENDLYIAYHDGSEWHMSRYRKVDTKSHSVTTQMYHFTSFAILAPKEPPPSTTPTPTEGTRVGNLAPDFQLHNLDGKPVSLSDFRGKPVFINFWASWCLPCRQEIPYIQEMYDEWSSKGLVVLTINRGEGSSQVREFMRIYNLSFPVLLDTKEKVAQKYNSWWIPTTFLIDKYGIIQAIKVGPFRSKAEIEQSLSKIIP